MVNILEIIKMIKDGVLEYILIRIKINMKVFGKMDNINLLEDILKMMEALKLLIRKEIN